MVLRAAVAVTALQLAAPGAADDDRLARLQARADEAGLASDAYWHKLLHYQPGWPGGAGRSAALPGGFFLAPDGHRDPGAELDATLAGLLEPAPGPAPHDQHVRCRFPARARWLAERLAMEPPALPEVRCERFREWYRAIGARSATLIFASAYLNNPASMYGHTLLRLDPEAGGGDRLLSYAVNYAANTAETSGLVFAVKGVTGGYLGQFSVMPYYEKVNEYSDLENRDLWEYRLALTPGEVDRMVRHLWELRQARFRYYFFLANCSYRLLELLEVARPGLELTDHFTVRAIPTDTVRVVLRQQGMLREVAYRPAEGTVLAHRLRRLTPAERDLAARISRRGPEAAGGALGSLAPARRASVLEAAYGHLHYRYLRGAAEPEAARSRMHRLLVSRSTLAGPTPPPQAPPRPPRPDLGHGTARLALAAGSERGEGYQELRLRPAYHDLLDPPRGYGEGQHIDFFDLQLRRWNADGRVRLERLDAVDITSIAPAEPPFRVYSWNLHASARRQPLEDDRRPLVGELGGGRGLAARIAAGPVVDAFAKLQGTAQVGPGLPRDYRLGAGPRAGLLADWGQTWRGLLDARLQWFVAESRPAWSLALEQRLALATGLAVGLRLAREREPDGAGSSVAGSLHYYF